MASIFKQFLNNDVASTRNLLNEAIPITGTVVSGTYSDQNVKNYSHGIFQSVYDFPIASSSANQLFDITFGYSPNSSLSASANEQNAKKINIYNQLAQVLVGYDVTGSILEFDEDGDIVAGGTKLREVAVLNYSRLLYKDEIKKGSYNLQLGVAASYATPFTDLITITDAGAQNDFRVNSPAGEYGILSSSASGNVGLLFYQAGVAILTASVFGSAQMLASGETVSQMLTGTTISGSSNALRHRFFNNSFNNTTELNSTIYFCRVNNNEFNYSANPTYVSASRINVKNSQLDAPVAYPTTVGLYSADNELLAVAKLSEPLRKDPTQEFTLRVRLDY